MKLSKNNIFLFCLTIIMFLINFLVGSSIKKTLSIFIIITILITIIYLIFNFKNNKFINNKLDIFVILFLLVGFLPLIFNTSISLSDEYNYIQESIAVLCVYILIKNLSLKKENKNKIINIIICATIPVIIIAIDRMFYNILWEQLVKFNNFNVEYSDSGILANFNYPNTLAIYLSSVYILIFPQILNSNSKKQLFYQSYSFILFFLIFLTDSRATYLLFFGFLIIHLFLLKKDDRLVLIKSIINSLLCVSFYFVVNGFISNITLKFIFLIFILIANFLLNIVTKKYKLKRIDYKKLCYSFGIFIIVFLIYIIVGLNISSPKRFINNESFLINNKENKKSFNISLDLDLELNSKIRIVIYKVNNNYYRERIINDEYIGNSVKKEYYLDGLKDTLYLEIKFENISDDSKVILNKVSIDNKKYIINYGILPTKLVNSIKSYNLKEQNLQMRFTYYKDSLKIAKNNTFLGNGSKAWRYLYKSVQDFSYFTKEVHSFVFDTLISFGIVGLMLLIIIIIYIIYYGYKIIKNKIKDYNVNISLIIAILLLLSHSLIDFDMSFLLIRVYFVSLIALVSNNFIDKYNTSKKNINSVVVIIGLSLVFMLSVLSVISTYYIKKVEKNESNSMTKYVKYKKISNLNPIDAELKYSILIQSDALIKEYGYNELDLNYIEYIIYFLKYEPLYSFNNIISRYIDQLILDIKYNNVNKYNIETLYYFLHIYSILNKFDILEMINRATFMIKLYESYEFYGNEYNNEYLLKEGEKIKKLILKEYNVNLKNVDDYKKTNYKKMDYTLYLKEYTDLIATLN